MLDVGRLHQLAGSLGDRDVGRSGAAPEGADDVAGEANHFSCWPEASRHDKMLACASNSVKMAAGIPNG